MAITWDTAIEVTDFAEKRVRVRYTRTDDAAGAVVPEWTWTASGIVDMADLPAFREKLTDGVWADWSAHLANQEAINSAVPGWESALADDIAAKEAE